jgi:hypothetical protein
MPFTTATATPPPSAAVIRLLPNRRSLLLNVRSLLLNVRVSLSPSPPLPPQLSYRDGGGSHV